MDKFLTTSRLAAAALPVPATILCEDSESAMTAFDELGGDVVVKPLFGSEGRGIVRVSDREIAQRVFRTLERIQAVLYIQRYVRHRGYDTRVLVLDGTVIGGMQRIAHDGFRTNVSQRGTTARCELSELERDLALRAIAVTGARFAGIDLLFDDDDRPWVIEVNAVPGWKAFAATTGIDVATVVLQTLVVSNRERNDGRTEAD